MLSKTTETVSTMAGGAPGKSREMLLPRYSKLGYVVLNVSDVERSTRLMWRLQVCLTRLRLRFACDCDE
jgi:hypothetical protein